MTLPLPPAFSLYIFSRNTRKLHTVAIPPHSAIQEALANFGPHSRNNVLCGGGEHDRDLVPDKSQVTNKNEVPDVVVTSGSPAAVQVFACV
jgi:hypothetical protein